MTRGPGLLLALLGVALLVIGGRLATAAPSATASEFAPAWEPRASEASGTGPGSRPDRGRAPAPPPAPAPAPAPAAPVPSTPVTLALPTQGVTAHVTPVGVLASGQLQLPADPGTVGWWAAGALPGTAGGTAVVAGHVDSADLGVGALQALLRVGIGDPVELHDATGATHRYRVVSRQSYRKAALPAELFTAEGPPQLALITCGGEFDRRLARYRDNVVVLATPSP